MMIPLSNHLTSAIITPMQNSKLNINTSHDEKTPSGRLNSWLDKFDWPPLENGRAQSIANALGCSKSTGRKYLQLNVLPRTQEEKKSTAYILNNISLPWWEYGIEDPQKTNVIFDDSMTSSIEQLEYIVVIERLAASMSINLKIEKIDSIKKIALHFSKITGIKKTNMDLIKELIKLAN
mgnify:CR=1 FL=1